MASYTKFLIPQDESMLDFNADVFNSGESMEYSSRSLVLYLAAGDLVSLLQEGNSSYDLSSIKFCVSLMKA